MVAFPFSFFLGPAAASLNSCRGDYSTSPTPREIPPRVKLKWRPSAVFISTLGRWWVYRVSLCFMGPVGGWVPSVALVLPYKERLGRVQREPQYSKSNISHIHAGPNHSPSTAAVGCFMPPVIRSSRHWHHQLMLLFIFIHYGGWARCEIWNIVTSLKNAPKACFFLYWYSCHCHIISFIVYYWIEFTGFSGFHFITSHCPKTTDDGSPFYIQYILVCTVDHYTETTEHLQGDGLFWCVCSAKLNSIKWHQIPIRIEINYCLECFSNGCLCFHVLFGLTSWSQFTIG